MPTESFKAKHWKSHKVRRDKINKCHNKDNNALIFFLPFSKGNLEQCT